MKWLSWLLVLPLSATASKELCCEVKRVQDGMYTCTEEVSRQLLGNGYNHVRFDVSRIVPLNETVEAKFPQKKGESKKLCVIGNYGSEYWYDDLNGEWETDHVRLISFHVYAVK